MRLYARVTRRAASVWAETSSALGDGRRGHAQVAIGVHGSQPLAVSEREAGGRPGGVGGQRRPSWGRAGSQAWEAPGAAGAGGLQGRNLRREHAAGSSGARAHQRRDGFGLARLEVDVEPDGGGFLGGATGQSGNGSDTVTWVGPSLAELGAGRGRP